MKTALIALVIGITNAATYLITDDQVRQALKQVVLQALALGDCEAAFSKSGTAPELKTEAHSG